MLDLRRLRLLRELAYRETIAAVAQSDDFPTVLALVAADQARRSYRGWGRSTHPRTLS